MSSTAAADIGPVDRILVASASAPAKLRSDRGDVGPGDPRRRVQVTVDVAPLAWGWDETREVVFHPADARGRSFAFTTPVHDDDAIVRLDVDEHVAT